MTIALWLGASAAHAASLDLLEVGGMYGTPAAQNPTALWWNPAGIGAGGGKFKFLVEGAPIFANVNVKRDNPAYPALDPQYAADGYPTAFDYSGEENFGFTGVAPFAGVTTKFLGIGLGAALAVPTARGGSSDQAFGPSRFALRDGNVQAVHGIFGASYSILNKVHIGASVHVVNSRWYADTDTSTLPDFIDDPTAALVLSPADLQDALSEDPGYTTTLVFGGKDGDSHGALTDTTAAFGAGIYLTPIGDKLGISLGYNRGPTLRHNGDLTYTFQCPPDYSLLSLAATGRGLCDVTVNGTATVDYKLPDRINFGVMISPIDKVRLEVMGAYVMWSQFTDYDLTTTITADQFPNVSGVSADANAELLSQERQRARDNQDTFWVGVDGKARLGKWVIGGARVTFDRHAVPSYAMAADNQDYDSVILAGMLEVTPAKPLGIGLSYSRHILMTRTVTDSANAIALAADERTEDRYFYPSTNGTYSGSINRLGIFVRGRFGGNPW